MKREIAFFRDRRAGTVPALVEAMRAVGMSADEIRAALEEMRAKQNPERPAAPSLPVPAESEET